MSQNTVKIMRQWRRSVINLGGPGLRPYFSLRQPSFFLFTFVDSPEGLAHPLPNIVMQFMQSNSFIKSILMFNVLPGIEISMHAEVSRQRLSAELIQWITGHV